MKLDPLLSKAVRLAKSGDYEGALKALRAEEDRYYGSFKYYYLYALISLYTGAFVDALRNFHLARKIKMKDPDTMLGLAVLYLKRMDTVQAVDYYLDVQEIDPKNKIVKRALSVIRKNSDPEALSEWLTPERLKKLFPPIPFAGIPLKMILTTVVIALVSLIIVSTILINLRVLPNPFRKAGDRPSAQFVLTGQERRAPVEVGGSYSYILTGDQAIALYDRALSLFTAHRDEAAKINLNRILESNASEGLKNRARILLENMEIPGFDTFRRGDNADFAEVISEPVVYRNVFVIWRGMATNIEVTDESTRFDFLVGYDTRRVLEGIIPVVFDRPVAINSERPLEVLARIELTGPNLDIRLQGLAIHQSGRLEN